VATAQQCLQCQCNQGGCDPALLWDCINSGFGFVRSCYDPLCAPWCSNPTTGTSQAVTGVATGDKWLSGLYGDIAEGKMSGGGCGCGCGAQNTPVGTGTASGPLGPTGRPIGGCGCSGVSASFSWWWILAIIAFFVLVGRRN
jgi:hypothetical protein